MNVFVDFEEAILLNNLIFEKLFISIRKYGFSFLKYINKVVLESLPYNPGTLSVLKDNYEGHTNTIYVLCKPENTAYAEVFKDNMKDIFKNVKILPIDRNNKLATIHQVCQDFEYIGGSLRDIGIYKKAKASSIISNIFCYTIHAFICNKIKDGRSQYFNGLFTLLFRYFHLVLPVFAIWPAWMEVNENILNLTKIKGLFISSIGFFSFMNLFRVLLSLDKERSYFQQDIKPLGGLEFIEGSTSIFSGIFILLIYFIFGCYGIFIHPIGGSIGLVLSIFYFVFCFSSFWVKWTRMLLVCFLFNILFNLTFAKKLFKFI